MRRPEHRRSSAVHRIGMSVGPDAAHTILSITENSGEPLVHTAAPSGLSGGETVVLSGTGLYDGAFTVDSNVGLDFLLLSAYVGDATGGSWRLA